MNGYDYLVIYIYNLPYPARDGGLLKRGRVVVPAYLPTSLPSLRSNREL